MRISQSAIGWKFSRSKDQHLLMMGFLIGNFEELTIKSVGSFAAP